MTTFKRRRLLVDRRLQGSIVSHALTAMAFALLVGIAGAIVPLIWQLSDGGSADHEGPGIIMCYLHERFWPIALISALIVAGSALHFSHRIAGPLVRVRRYLRRLGDGEIPPALQTRRRDFLKNEVECLNFATDGIARRIAAVHRAQHAVELAFAELRTTPGCAADEALERAIAEMGSAIAEFRPASRSTDESPDHQRPDHPVLVVDDTGR